MCAERGRARLCDLDDASLDVIAVLWNRQRLADARIVRLENENREARAQVRLRPARSGSSDYSTSRPRAQVCRMAECLLIQEQQQQQQTAAAAAAAVDESTSSPQQQSPTPSPSEQQQLQQLRRVATSERRRGPKQPKQSSAHERTARAPRVTPKATLHSSTVAAATTTTTTTPNKNNNKTRAALRPSVRAIASQQQEPRAHPALPTPTQIIAATRLQAAVRGNAARGIAARRALYARVGV